MIIKGMIVNCEGIYYEFISTNNKNREAAPTGYLVRRLLLEDQLPKPPVRVSVKLRDENTGRLKSKTHEFPPGSNEYEFFERKPRERVMILDKFHIRKRFLESRPVDYRLTINNIVGKLIFGEKYTTKVIKSLIIKRLYGTTKNIQAESGSSNSGDDKLRRRYSERPIGI